MRCWTFLYSSDKVYWSIIRFRKHLKRFFSVRMVTIWFNLLKYASIVDRLPLDHYKPGHLITALYYSPQRFSWLVVFEDSLVIFTHSTQHRTRFRATISILFNIHKIHVFWRTNQYSQSFERCFISEWQYQVYVQLYNISYRHKKSCV